MLTKCVSCGREKTTLTRVSFGLNLGGILCQTCRRGESNIISLSSDGLQFLLGMVGGQIGSDHRNSDNWNQVERHVAEGLVGGPNEVRENNRKQREWSEHVSQQTTSSHTDSMTKDVVDRTNCQAEVKHLVHKYITHLVGFPPKLHKYLKNI